VPPVVHVSRRRCGQCEVKLVPEINWNFQVEIDITVQMANTSFNLTVQFDFIKGVFLAKP